jgi:mono/diheme cytochrome c family protein
MSKFGIGIIAMFLVLGLLPFVLVARSRASHSSAQEIHLIFDMDNQSRFDPQATSPVFADGRSMRPQIAGTVAQEDMELRNEVLNDVDHPRLVDGTANEMVLSDPGTYAAVMLGRIRAGNMTDEQFDDLTPPADDKSVAGDTKFYVRTIPAEVKVSQDLIHRGQERFTIYCAPCHGQSGYGDGMVDQRATAIQAAGGDAAWTHPQNLHEAKILARPDGHIFNTITNGARTMPAYDKQITVLDRWAIVAYVRALQRSQQALPADLNQQANASH